jgi:hypothetical protein
LFERVQPGSGLTEFQVCACVPGVPRGVLIARDSNRRRQDAVAPAFPRIAKSREPNV